MVRVEVRVRAWVKVRVRARLKAKVRRRGELCSSRACFCPWRRLALAAYR